MLRKALIWLGGGAVVASAALFATWFGVAWWSAQMDKERESKRPRYIDGGAA